MLSWRCPVSDDLDLIRVARQYVQFELPAFALACLMLMPHSEKRHQEIKVFCKVFLRGCQGCGRSHAACPLQKVPLSFHQTCKAWVGWKVCVGVWWEARLRDRWRFVWRLPEEEFAPYSLSVGNSEFSCHNKVKWSGSIFEGIIHVGLIRGERGREVKLGNHCIWIGIIQQSCG